MAHSRVTLSLPPGVASDLDYMAGALGISRSAFASLVLEHSFRSLVPAVEYASQSSAGGLAQRLRGASGAALRAEYASLVRLAESIDPDAFELTPPTDGEG